MNGKHVLTGRRNIRISLFLNYNILNEYVIRCALTIVSLAWKFWVIVPQPLTDLNTITYHNITPIWGVRTHKMRVFCSKKNHFQYNVRISFNVVFHISVPNISVIHEYMYSHKIRRNAPSVWFSFWIKVSRKNGCT